MGFYKRWPGRAIGVTFSFLYPRRCRTRIPCPASWELLVGKTGGGVVAFEDLAFQFVVEFGAPVLGQVTYVP